MASVAPSSAAADREAVRRAGLPAFVELALRHKMGHTYRPGRHMVVCAEAFERLYHGETEVLNANLPPGTSKSQVFSVCGPAWVWAMDPAYVLMCASYDADLSRFLASQHQELCESAWYRDRWGDVVIPGSAVAELWTTHDGFRLSTSIKGGRGIGRHCHMYVIDDPFPGDNAQRTRATVLDYTQGWFRSRVLTRGRPGVRQKICVVMQRLHEDDLSGYVHAAYASDPKYESLVLPLYYEQGLACAREWRTKPGDVLWREDAENLARKAQHFAEHHGGLNGSEFRAAYQQDPRGGDDRVWNAADLRDLDGVAFRDTLSVISVDPTFTGGPRSDLMSIEVWGYLNGHFYCFHAEASRRNFQEAYQAIMRVREQWPAYTVLIEASANGHALQEQMARVIPGVVKEPADKSKGERARAAAHYAAVGRVHFDKSAPWYEEKARDLERFPHGTHDDRVDTTSQAILWLVREYGAGEHFTQAIEAWKQEMNEQALPATALRPALTWGRVLGLQ